MEILGYVAYVLLIFLAITWALGVRLKLGVSIATIFGSLFFTISAIIIPISKASLLNAIWIIPVGFLFPLLLSFFSRFKIISYPLVFLSSIYAGILRLGINKNKIKKAQDESNLEAVEKWSEKQK